LKVFKNNFARVAFDELKNNEVSQYLSGPTAIALIKEGPLLCQLTDNETQALEISGDAFDTIAELTTLCPNNSIIVTSEIKDALKDNDSIEFSLLDQAFMEK